MTIDDDNKYNYKYKSPSPQYISDSNWYINDIVCRILRQSQIVINDDLFILSIFVHRKLEA